MGTFSTILTILTFSAAPALFSPSFAAYRVDPGSFLRSRSTVVAPASTTTAPAPQGPGTFRCTVLDNGLSARGRVTLSQGSRVVASGACGTALQVPAGTYRAIVTLDGALDRPTQTRTLAVTPGGTASFAAGFRTALLEVRVMANGRPAPGRAVLTRDGRTIASVGSGIVAKVSAGTYHVRALYRTAAQDYDVPLYPGQRRAIIARF